MDEQLEKRGPGRPSKEREDGAMVISPSELQTLIAQAVAAAVSQTSKESSKLLIEALTEIRKPWQDPNKAENDRRMNEQNRVLQEKLRLSLENDRRNCPHLQGSNSLSEEQGSRLSIWWHQLDSGTYWGICSNCQRQFWPSDPDYRQWRARKSGNRPSAAGQRQFVDTKAWEAQEHPVPFSAEFGANF